MHEVLLVLDATTGMNALTQAREFHKTVPLTGLSGGDKIGRHEQRRNGGGHSKRTWACSIKFIGLGEQADDLQPFDAKQYAEALFEE